jgi:hypothetical protein
MLNIAQSHIAGDPITSGFLAMRLIPNGGVLKYFITYLKIAKNLMNSLAQTHFMNLSASFLVILENLYGERAF